VNVSTNGPQPELTLVFPEEETGPRILGTIKTPTGALIPPRAVYIRMQAGETNYQVNAVSDTNGSYSARVLPGRWLVTTYNVQQPVSTVALVSSNDVEVNFEQVLPAPQAFAYLTLSLAGDTEWMEPEPFTLGSAFEWYSTYTDATPFSLRPGVWRMFLNQVTYVGGTPEFMLLPSLTFALAPASSTNLVLAVQQTTRRIEGRIRDQDGRLQSTGYAVAWTSLNGTNFWVNGLITSGYFSLNVFPGRWQVGASLTGYPAVGYAENGTPGRPRPPYETAVPTTYSTTPLAVWIQVSNQTVRCEFVVTNTPVGPLSSLNVAVLREDGESVAGLDVFISDLLSIWIDGVTDSNGLSRLNVPQGPFTIRAGLPSYGFTYEPLLWPNLALPAVPQDQPLVLVVRRPTRCIGGTIENVSVFGLQPRILASTVINGTNYYSTGSPDTQGHFCLPAIHGTWTVSVDDEYLNAYGISSVPKQTVTVSFIRPPDSLTFVLARASQDFRHARLFTPRLLPDSGIEVELESVTALNWLFERSEDLTHWTPFTLGYSENGRFVLKDAQPHSARPMFYRAIWAR
jgi:hypothetical protein